MQPLKHLFQGYELVLAHLAEDRPVGRRGRGLVVDDNGALGLEPRRKRRAGEAECPGKVAAAQQTDAVTPREVSRGCSEARRRHVEAAVDVVLGVDHPDEELEFARADEVSRRVALALDRQPLAVRVDAGDVDAEVSWPAATTNVPVAVVA